MRSLTLIMSALMLVHGLPSTAATISYEPVPGYQHGVITGEVPVNKIDAMRIAGVKASVQGNSINIVRDGDTQNVLLNGVVLNQRMTTEGPKAKYTAVAFFQAGAQLPKLAKSSNEAVELADHSVIHGTIRAVTPDEVAVDTSAGERTVPLNKVASISSPRLFAVTAKADSKSVLTPDSPFQANCDGIEFKQLSKTQLLAQGDHFDGGSSTGSYQTRDESAITQESLPVQTDAVQIERQLVAPATTEFAGSATSCPPSRVIRTCPAVVAPAPMQTLCAPAVVDRRERGDGWLLKALIAGGIIATAIAVPLGVTLGNRGGNRNRRLQEQLVAQNLIIARQQQLNAQAAAAGAFF